MPYNCHIINIYNFVSLEIGIYLLLTECLFPSKIQMLNLTISVMVFETGAFGRS